MMQTKESPALGTLGSRGSLDSHLTASIVAHHGVTVTVPATGERIRFDDKGRMGRGPLWAINLGTVGIHGDWREGKPWHLVFPDGEHDPAKAEEARRRADEAKRQYEKERREKQTQVAAQCRAEWPALPLAEPSHPYLVAKQVQPHTLRQRGNALVVPLSDGERMVNFQTIQPDGAKRFRRGARLTGCYHPMGTISPDKPLLICEGFSTGASLHEATGLPVACAMNAGNLLPVCESFRRRYPSQPIVVAADTDHVKEAQGKGNAGLTKAREAARFIGAGVIWPPFNEDDQGTDFNDWLRAGGSIEV